MDGMDGYVTIGTKLDTTGMDSGIKDMKKSLENEISNLEKSVNSSMSNLEKGILKTFSTIKNIVLGVGLALLFKQITGSINDAISRLDILNNYTKVMSNLGVSADDAKQSIDYLSEKLTGLPTTLNDAVLSVQRFTSANNNVKASTEMFLALNNAILAGGANTVVQASALEQLSQAYAKGKPDMMEWRTAMMAMPAQLKQVATAMGFVSADELGASLRNGTTSMNEFMKTLMQLNKQGINGFSSFEEQARNATGGVATSMTNVKTAITRGLAQIMEAIGQSNIASFFNGITRAINSVIPYIVAFVKLMVTAVSFIGGLFGKSTQKNIENTGGAIGGVSNTMNDLGESADSTAGSMDNATGSAKALKNELKQIASFDELNVLKDNSSSGGGGGGGAGGGADLSGFDLSGFDTDISNVTSKADELVNKVKEIAKQVGDLISQGFKLSFEDTNFDGIKRDIAGIKKSLIEIWEDGEVKKSIEEFGKTYLITLGEIAGAIARIGTNISEGFLGSINYYLYKNKDRIKQTIINIFDIETEILRLTGAFAKAVGRISDVFASSEAKQVGANILEMFVNPILSATELLFKFARDISNIFFAPIINNTEKIKTAFLSTFDIIGQITGTLAEIFTYIGDRWNEVYDESISPFLQNLAGGISDTLGKFLDAYNKYIAPSLNKMAKAFDDTWKSHLKPFLDNAYSLMGKVFDFLNTFWQSILKPFIDWIIQNILPIIMPIVEKVTGVIVKNVNQVIDNLNEIIKVLQKVIEFLTFYTSKWAEGWNIIKNHVVNSWNTMRNTINTISNMIRSNIQTVFSNIKNTISNIWNGVSNTTSSVWNTIKSKVSQGASGAYNAITSVFSTIPNWFRTVFAEAWQNVKDVFSSGGEVFEGIQEGILSSLKSIINGLIRGINNVISSAFSGLNNSLRKIKNVNILGTYPFGSISTINVPRIPYLKSGGIINMPNKRKNDRKCVCW